MSHPDQPAHHLKEATSGSVPVGASSGEPVDWQQLYQELIAERDQLRKELTAVKTERDDYLQSLYALTHKEFDFDKEELLASISKQKPLREFIEDLEKTPGALCGL